MPATVNLFTPTDWYWFASDGRVYTSKRQKIITSNDAGYLAFVAKNGAASPWPKDTTGAQTNAALAAVLNFYGVTNTLS